MKKLISVCAVFLCLIFISGCQRKKSIFVSDLNAADFFKDIPTTQFFLDEKIPEADVEKILEAGFNCPSAMNHQPWHFTAVTNKKFLFEVYDDLIRGMTEEEADNYKRQAEIKDVPLVIVISSEKDYRFDAGLACSVMAVEANLLGYGTKIVNSPNLIFQGKKQQLYKEMLGIPVKMEAVGYLLIGKADLEKIDALSSASTRKPRETIISYYN